VLDSIAVEDLDAAVVHLDGNGNAELALGTAKNGVDPGIEAEDAGSGVQLRLHRFIEALRPLGLDSS
jgi:hypothetical protein